MSAVIRGQHRHAAFLGPAMGLRLTDALAPYHLANEPLTAAELRNRVGLSTGRSPRWSIDSSGRGSRTGDHTRAIGAP